MFGFWLSFPPIIVSNVLTVVVRNKQIKKIKVTFSPYLLTYLLSHCFDFGFSQLNRRLCCSQLQMIQNNFIESCMQSLNVETLRADDDCWKLDIGNWQTWIQKNQCFYLIFILFSFLFSSWNSNSVYRIRFVYKTTQQTL